MRLREPAEEGAYGGPSTVPVAGGGGGAGHWEWVRDGPSPAPRSGYRRRRRFRWLRRLLTLIIGLVLLAVLTLGGLLLVTPSVGNAPALARSFDREHHAVYPGPPVPEKFAAALTATEDHRFYSEPGIDPAGVARVVVNAALRRPDQGGATLYQQLAKMLYTPGGSGNAARAEQVAVGIKLDLAYSKPQILRMYADVAYFGHGYYGVRQASCGYFGVQPASLSWPQAAMLAGLVQAPSLDDPLISYANARARESHVLGRLAAVGALTPAQAAAEYARPLHLIPGGGHCASS
jgi:penicillin-binding protein 1A